MILIDKILLAPIYGTIWLAQKLNDAAQQEIAQEDEKITTQLTELYMMLETGQISEQEFDEKEKELLDRLDAMEDEQNDTEGSHLERE